MVQAMLKVPEFLLISDAARMLGVGNEMVRKLVRQEKLSVAARTPAGYRLFDRAEVERLQSQRQNKPPHAGRPKKKTRKVSKKKTGVRKKK